MKIRVAFVFALAPALAAGAVAQDSGAAGQSPVGQASPSAVGQNAGGQNSNGQNVVGQNPGAGGADGQRGGRGGFGGMGLMGRGMAGTVTEVAADHFSVKSFLGETYTIQFSGRTRFFKMPAGMHRGEGENGGPGGGQGSGQANGQGGGRGQGRGMGNGGNPPQAIKPADIKVGDVIEARGEVDATAKSVGAQSIALIDPERAAQMQAMEANFGKTWLMGKVTAIDGVKVTLTGALDNAPHSFVADENTTFRRRRDPITLADIQLGDTVRADGAMKDGAFTATAVGDMGASEGENPRGPGSGAGPGAGPVAAPAPPQ
jgi:hypothetical protein